LGTGVEVRRDDVVGWLRHVIPAYGLFAVAILAVTAVAKAGSTGLLVVAGAFLVLCTVLFDASLRRQRALTGPAARLLRIVLGAVQLAIGLWLTLWVDGDGWKFLGVTSLAFVVATVLAELRYSVRWLHTRGPVVLSVAALLVLLGLFPIAAISFPAGLSLAGFGIVAVVIGGELHAEDWLRAVRTRSPRTMRRIGAALLGLSAVILTAAGSQPAYVLLLFVVLTIAVATVSSDSDGGEVAVVLVAALVWASAPREAPPTAVTNPQPGQSFFVALGDSYISGEGAERFFDGTNSPRENQCRRAPTAYPVRLAERGGEEIPDHVLFLACSGARAVDLYGERPGRTEPVSQLDQYRQAMTRLDEGDLEFVLLSIGGNDADFSVLGRTCIGPGDCSEIGQRWLDRLEDVERRLDTAYAELAADVSDVPVYVVPYPVPLTEHGCWWSWLTDDEHRFINGFVDELNTVVESAARRNGFQYLRTMEEAFVEDDLRICDRFGPGGLGMNFLAMNPASGSLDDVVDPRNWIHNSLHPNATGHEAMFRTAQEWLTSPQTSELPPEGEGPVEVGDLDDVVSGDRVEQCGSANAPPYCSQQASEWQGSQTRSLLRLALLPLVLALVGCWMLVMPSLRWANEHRFNLSRPLLAFLGMVGSWFRGPGDAGSGEWHAS